MKQAVRLTVGLLFLSLILLSTSVAQDQYNEGTVERVTWSTFCPDTSTRS